MNTSWFDLPIQAAKAGDDVAARALVGLLADYLEKGEVPPKALAGYFVPALKQIAAGREADKVFNPGKKSATFKEHYAIAREVWMLNHRAKNHLPLDDNKKKKGAFSIVGEKYRHLSAARIKQIYDGMKGLIEAEFLDDQITDDKARQQFEVNQHIILGQLAETLKKRVRN
ncbi:hypothetical protein [Pseudomonas sp. LB3P14]